MGAALWGMQVTSKIPLQHTLQGLKLWNKTLVALFNQTDVELKILHLISFTELLFRIWVHAKG